MSGNGQKLNQCFPQPKMTSSNVVCPQPKPTTIEEEQKQENIHTEEAGVRVLTSVDIDISSNTFIGYQNNW